MMTNAANTLEALYSTAHWLMAQNRYRDAIPVFRTMMVVEPRDERGWLGLGTCHESVGESNQALAIFDLAPHACGAQAIRCTVARARLLRETGALDEARDAYRAALSRAEELGDDDLSEMIVQEMGLS
jgi:tetratricopeptide (TPR) repeat protein